MMQTIITLLIQCEALLRKVDEVFWADKFMKVIDATQGEKKPEHALMNEVLLWFGGMGSFNDLILSKHNDHNVHSADEDELNEELSTLRNEIYKYARNSIDNS